MDKIASSKVVLITGASSGIGKAIAEHLQKNGYRVFGTSRNPLNQKTPPSFPLVAMDVTRHHTIVSAIEEVLSQTGKIDVLINNAGVGITGPIEETPDEEIKKAFDTNFFGPLQVIKSVLPNMRENGGGLILNITSIAGYMGLPFRGIYSATKGALELTTEAYRMELRSFNIEMVNVAPGDFATNIAAGRYHAPLLEDSPYREAYGNTLKLMNQHVDQGKNPQEMAEAVLKIIETRHPKVHYRVGDGMQKFSVVLKKILPDKMYERLLLKHYKL